MCGNQRQVATTRSQTGEIARDIQPGAVRLLATRASSINDAAELVGYDGQRGVRRQSESIWGLPPRAAALLPTDKLLRGIIEFTTRGQPRRY